MEFIYSYFFDSGIFHIGYLSFCCRSDLLLEKAFISQPLRIIKRKIKNGAVMFLTVFGTCLGSATAKGIRRHWKSYSKWRTMLQLENFPDILDSFAKRQRSAFTRYKRNHGVLASIQGFIQGATCIKGSVTNNNFNFQIKIIF
jgi:hypothetical protein